MNLTKWTYFFGWVIITLIICSTFTFFHQNEGNPIELDNLWYSYYDPCFMQRKINFCGERDINSIPLIYAITPTYKRYTQKADLTRLSNTLRWICKLHWIVIEDASDINSEILQLLKESDLSFTYLSQATDKTTHPSLKGIHQRNAGLDWISDHHIRQSKAVFYFVDDDNTYTTEIFEQLRCTQKLSMFPVGFSGGKLYETPILTNGKITGFDAWENGSRTFPVDMAGFALNIDVLWKYEPMRFDINGRPSYQETHFLEKCCTIEDIEPLADNCNKVLVWHTKTTEPNVEYPSVVQLSI